MHRAALAVVAVLAFAPAARADRWLLKDGSAVSGVLLRQEGDTLVVLTEKGERQLAAGDVLETKHEDVAPALAKKAEKARAAWREQREKDARAALRRHARAKTDEERAAAAAALRACPPDAQPRPLEDALDDGDEATRDFALARLKELPGQDATDALLRAVMTGKRSDSRDQAHAVAVGRDKERTRTVYESVLETPTKPARRFRALERLAQLADPASIPGLIFALERIQNETRATLATAGPMKQAQVDLGSTQAAGTKVPIDLPEMQLVEVQSTTSVVVLRQLHDETTRLLRQLSGVDKGKDPGAWRRWYDTEKK